MRETVLQYLQKKEFDSIVNILRDHKAFDLLLDDVVFKQVFFQNFTNELLSMEDLDLAYPVFLYQCHISKNYKFSFDSEDEERLLKFLIDKTKDYNYALKLPLYEPSIAIINKHNTRLLEEVEKSKYLAKKNKDLKIVELYSNNTEHLIKSIFNSPQEKEFYFACKDVFNSHIILPNVSLTTLFNHHVVKLKFPEYYSFYQKASIDFVIVDNETFIPVLFFELDSNSYHTDPTAKMRDNIKNILLTELGNDMIRVTKRTGKESIDEYKDFLKILKEEKNL